MKFRALLDAFEGTCTLRSLDVTLRLKGFDPSSREDNLSAATVCAFTPTVPDVAPFSLPDLTTTAVSMPPIKSALPDVPSSTLNPYNEIAFDAVTTVLTLPL